MVTILEGVRFYDCKDSLQALPLRLDTPKHGDRSLRQSVALLLSIVTQTETGAVLKALRRVSLQPVQSQIAYSGRYYASTRNFSVFAGLVLAVIRLYGLRCYPQWLDALRVEKLVSATENQRILLHGVVNAITRQGPAARLLVLNEVRSLVRDMFAYSARFGETLQAALTTVIQVRMPTSMTLAQLCSNHIDLLQYKHNAVDSTDLLKLVRSLHATCYRLAMKALGSIPLQCLFLVTPNGYSLVAGRRIAEHIACKSLRVISGNEKEVKRIVDCDLRDLEKLCDDLCAARQHSMTL